MSDPESITKKGDWGYIKNKGDYPDKKIGPWRGENVIAKGGDIFWGINSTSVLSYTKWKDELVIGYNYSENKPNVGSVPNITATEVLGWKSDVHLFFDVAKVGEDAFNK